MRNVEINNIERNAKNENYKASIKELQNFSSVDIGVLKDQSEKIDLTIKSLDYYFSIVPHKKGSVYRINHDKIANYA